jgi:hypothetical protein
MVRKRPRWWTTDLLFPDRPQNFALSLKALLPTCEKTGARHSKLEDSACLGASRMAKASCSQIPYCEFGDVPMIGGTGF